MDSRRITFLTSSPDGDLGSDNGGSPFGYDNRNNFADRLRAALPEPVFFTYFAADSDNSEQSEQAAAYFAGVFERSGIPLTGYTVCDRRNAQDTERLLAHSGVIMLAGGHVPTQNAFFEEIHLRERIKDYRGVVIGVSAGSMNSADLVYAQPEEQGEAVDPDYIRFRRGLDLTKRQVLPHYQLIRDCVLDGMRLFEEITAADSMGHCFYVLRDGSYIMIRDGKEYLFGEAWTMEDGQLQKICEYGECMLL